MTTRLWARTVLGMLLGLGGMTAGQTATSATIAQSSTQAPTNITIVTSSNPYVENSTETITVIVTSNGSPMTVGGVTITSLGITECAANSPLNSQGEFVCSNGIFEAGPQRLVASYSDPSQNYASNSNYILFDVQRYMTLSLASSMDPSAIGTAVTLTATFNLDSTCSPSGSIVFTDNGNPLNTAPIQTPVNVGSYATVVTSSLTPGSHTITANYSGDSFCSSATASPITQTVQIASSVNGVTIAGFSNVVFDPVTLQAQVSGAGSTPTGSVIFLDFGQQLGSAPLDGAGVATLSTSQLRVGRNSITAYYSGDGTYGPSSSSPSFIYRSPRPH